MRLFWDFSILNVCIILFSLKNVVSFFFSMIIFECEFRNDSTEGTLNYQNSVLDLCKHFVDNKGIHSIYIQILMGGGGGVYVQLRRRFVAVSLLCIVIFVFTIMSLSKALKRAAFFIS